MDETVEEGGLVEGRERREILTKRESLMVSFIN